MTTKIQNLIAARVAEIKAALLTPEQENDPEILSEGRLNRQDLEDLYDAAPDVGFIEVAALATVLAELEAEDE